MKKIYIIGSVLLVAAIFIFIQSTQTKVPENNSNTAIPFGTDTNLVGGDAVPTSGTENVMIEAVGTEPFWNFEYKNGSLKWQAPAADSVGNIVTTLYDVGYAGNADNSEVTLRGLGDSVFGVKITAKKCSDGMSEIVYTHEVEVRKENMQYRGCANIKNL